MADETAKYTAKDMYVAFHAGGIFREAQSGTRVEAWKAAVKRSLEAVEENERPANNGMKVADFERQFDAALKAVLDERG